MRPDSLCRDIFLREIKTMDVPQINLFAAALEARRTEISDDAERAILRKCDGAIPFLGYIDQLYGFSYLKRLIGEEMRFRLGNMYVVIEVIHGTLIVIRIKEKQQHDDYTVETVDQYRYKFKIRPNATMCDAVTTKWFNTYVMPLAHGEWATLQYLKRFLSNLVQWMCCSGVTWRDSPLQQLLARNRIPNVNT